MKITSKNIFFIDGLGALVSFVVLLIFGCWGADFVGLSKQILLRLSILPFIFACYSLGCFYFKPNNWALFLKGIAFANLGYCLLSLFILICNYKTLTTWGLGYFVLEKIVILFLVYFELRIAREKKPFHLSKTERLGD